jgi:hypothetical protein
LARNPDDQLLPRVGPVEAAIGLALVDVELDGVIRAAGQLPASRHDRLRP